MATYRLSPRSEHLSHRDWAASTIQDEMLVGADDENHAREIAMAASCIATKVDGGPMRFSPWLQDGLTNCELTSRGELVEVPVGKLRLTNSPTLLDPFDL